MSISPVQGYVKHCLIVSFHFIFRTNLQGNAALGSLLIESPIKVDTALQ